MPYPDTTWRWNSNYWTWGFRLNKSTSENFHWCNADVLEVSSSVVQWHSGQPDNLGGNQRCMHLRVLTNVSKMVVSDRNCSDKYVYACEVLKTQYNMWMIISSIQLQTPVTTPAPIVCKIAQCPSVNCSRDVCAIFQQKNIKI